MSVGAVKRGNARGAKGHRKVNASGDEERNIIADSAARLVVSEASGREALTESARSRRTHEDGIPGVGGFDEY